MWLLSTRCCRVLDRYVVEVAVACFIINIRDEGRIVKIKRLVLNCNNVE